LRVEYLTFYFAPPSFALFIHSLYPKDILTRFIQGAFGLALAFSAFMLLTDTLTFSKSVPYYQTIILLEVLYFLYVLGRVLLLRREGAGLVGLACLVLFASIVVDVLHQQGWFPFGELTAYGFSGAGLGQETCGQRGLAQASVRRPAANGVWRGPRSGDLRPTGFGAGLGQETFGQQGDFHSPFTPSYCSSTLRPCSRT
jgi:hypothetical protein